MTNKQEEINSILKTIKDHFESEFNVLGERYMKIIVKRIIEKEELEIVEIQGGHNTVFTEYAGLIISLVSLIIQLRKYKKKKKKNSIPQRNEIEKLVSKNNITVENESYEKIIKMLIEDESNS